MSAAMRRGTLLLLCALAAPASAAPSSPARIAQIAALPDWSGIWQGEGRVDTLDPSGRPPPYTPAFQARYAATSANFAHLVDPRVRICTFGFPRLLGTRRKFTIAVTPEQTLIHADQREIRHIWTDGRDHPKAVEMWPTEWGDSIGHWNGQALLVDTVMPRADLWIDATGATLSDQARIAERWTMPEHDHLRVVVTITDPVALARPWSFTRSFARTHDRWLVEDLCDWTAGTANATTK